VAPTAEPAAEAVEQAAGSPSVGAVTPAPSTDATMSEAERLLIKPPGGHDCPPADAITCPRRKHSAR
jgi:hypothetical protein